MDNISTSELPVLLRGAVEALCLGKVMDGRMP